MDKKRFYITTTLPYVNADPHIGFALEIVQADAIARYHHLKGDEVIFNTGTDEHGLKVYRNAQESGKSVQNYVDENAAKFDRLKQKLNLSYTNFTRTTDPHHVAAAQEFWRRCRASGDIDIKDYEMKYCVGCELEKTDSELVDGRCPIHPNLDLEIRREKNYFFDFPKYKDRLLKLYQECSDFVVPNHRLTEIRKFVAAGLQPFSVSRLKSKMPWGVPVPDDDDHVMYVWFDALVNYISTLGWPENDRKFEEFWGTKERPSAIQVAGKDNLRQQSAMWQAMLMSAGLPPSRQIIIHGFINSGGQKMSKSLGNVVDPFAVVEKYGTDALRFWLLHDMTPFEDGDFTWEKFNESYNAYLANGLGNLIARIMQLVETYIKQPILPKLGFQDLLGLDAFKDVPVLNGQLHITYREALEHYEFNNALGIVWAEIRSLDKKINDEKPFELVHTDLKKGEEVIHGCALRLWAIGKLLEPFMPSTSDLICKSIISGKKPAILFPRIK